MQKDFDRWNEIKKKINQRGYPKINLGEVWWCAFGLNIGVEQDGDSTNFQRPVIIIYKFSNQIVLVAPITKRNTISDWYYPIKLSEMKKANIILNQIKPVDTKRLVKRKGQILEKHRLNILKEYIDLLNKKHPEG